MILFTFLDTIFFTVFRPIKTNCFFKVWFPFEFGTSVITWYCGIGLSSLSSPLLWDTSVITCHCGRGLSSMLLWGILISSLVILEEVCQQCHHCYFGIHLSSLFIVKEVCHHCQHCHYFILGYFCHHLLLLKRSVITVNTFITVVWDTSVITCYCGRGLSSLSTLS